MDFSILYFNLCSINQSCKAFWFDFDFLHAYISCFLNLVVGVSSVKYKGNICGNIKYTSCRWENTRAKNVIGSHLCSLHFYFPMRVWGGGESALLLTFHTFYGCIFRGRGVLYLLYVGRGAVLILHTCLTCIALYISNGGAISNTIPH